MKKGIRSLYYVPHQKFLNRHKMYAGHVFSHTILTKFPFVEFQVTARQREDVDPGEWKWKNDLFDVAVWNHEKLKLFFRQLRLPTSFLTGAKVEAKTLLDIWTNCEKKVFTDKFPSGFGMNAFQYDKFSDAMRVLKAKTGLFQNEEHSFSFRFSLHAATDSAAWAPKAGNKFAGTRA